MSHYTSPITGKAYAIPAQSPAEAAATADRMRALRDRLDREGDAAIDFSDIPDITPEQFATARRVGRPRRAATGTVTVNARIDADIVQWLKSPGDGYQTRMNAILRAAMLMHQTMDQAPSGGEAR